MSVSPEQTELLHGPLAEALERGRSVYNARARAAASAIDGPALLGALRCLDPVARAAAEHDRAALDGVVSALFDASLVLVSRGMLGPAARRPLIGATWCALLAACPAMLVADPRRVVAATGNACTRIAEVRGARPADWAATMATMAARAPGVDSWLRAGTVAGWRSGLAHTRSGALDVAAGLTPDLAALALGLDASTSPSAVALALKGLGEDPWSWPPDLAAGIERAPGIRLVGRIGGFRGFVPAGRFLAPPKVGVRDGVFLVSDTDRTFELHADFFGATLVPVGPCSPLPPGRGAMTLGPGGEVRHGELARVFPGFVKDVTWASTDSTLVAALRTSHHLSLFARSGYGV